ncbi:MAG: DNA/pantothenate metabolism flavoprotein domain protein [Verrucomicrobia bacterium]|jgi:phosphopantothenoylcysteine decarboxylase/phosphopantothenate--cysteine ligase|nr:DNA/pantothenate metabolism flavoprotein domain protein [Verrucomicrobiota bacterium]
MHFIVTAGPTFEPLDRVRRLTNFSTGRLGTELAVHLARQGHEVTLMLSEQAVYRGGVKELEVVPFTTTASLRAAFVDASKVKVNAVFHAAAVCDFTFGQAWRRDAQGGVQPVQEGKLGTRAGTLLVELVPTPKLIAELREWFPDSWLLGWKYEVDGNRGDVLAAAQKQIQDYRTSGCIANGPAYGSGFGLVFNGDQTLHLPDAESLFSELLRMITG